MQNPADRAASNGVGAGYPSRVHRCFAGVRAHVFKLGSGRPAVSACVAQNARKEFVAGPQYCMNITHRSTSFAGCVGTPAVLQGAAKVMAA